MSKLYRMTSFWLRQEDLAWPDKKIREKFRIRAEKMAENFLDSAIIFGAHFRWDFEKEFGRLHELIDFASLELAKYGILLFDHHSAVLTRNTGEVPPGHNPGKQVSNHAQILVSPPKGMMDPPRHDDWKMLRLSDGEEVFLPQYGSREFCINNPDFKAAYREYLQRLLKETHIGGLMSDDALYYAQDSCSCPFCRKDFEKRMGFPMPPGNDTSFWGKWDNPAYLEYIRFRQDTVSDFTKNTFDTLPEGFPLMHCCAASITYGAAERGNSYEIFLRGNANHIMMEMCGNTPRANGDFPSVGTMLYHQAMSREKDLPSIGLGYGFSKDNGNFIWAFNKFLGAGTWFSTLSQRMGLSQEDFLKIPDDPVFMGEAFEKEIRYREFFEETKSVNPVAIYFSRNTQHNYAGRHRDFAADYGKLADTLLRAGIPLDTVYRIPGKESHYKVLVIPSAVALSREEEEELAAFREGGKLVILSGPFGFHNADGSPRAKSFAEEMGLPVTLPVLSRQGVPPNIPNKDDDPVYCSFPAEMAPCIKIRENFVWFPARALQEIHPLLLEMIQKEVIHGPSSWLFSMMEDKEKRLICHYLSGELTITLKEDWEKLRDPESPSYEGMKFIDSILLPAGKLFTFPVPKGYRKAELLEVFSCGEEGVKELAVNKEGKVEVELSPKSFYFILRFGK